MKTPLRVLIVEDSEDDTQLLARELERAGYAPHVERVDTEPAMQRALDAPWHLVISDYNMPGFSGTSALALLRRRGLDTPFIFVSGTVGEDVAVAAMKAGASDYVMKDNLRRLVPAIERELREAEVRREGRRAEDALVERARLAELGSDVGRALTQGAPLGPALARCAAALVSHLDVACACIWTYDAREDSLELMACAGLPGGAERQFGRLAPQGSPLEACVRDRRPVTRTLGVEAAGAPGPWMHLPEARTLSAWPLTVGRRVVGAFAVLGHHPESDSANVALESIGHQLAAEIERQRAEEELRRSEDRFGRVFRNSPIAIGISTLAEGRYVDVNDAFLALVGGAREQVVGQPALDFVAWRDPRARGELTERLHELGAVHNLDLEVRTLRGDTRSVLASYEHIELGSVPCLISILHDVSERKRLEAQLRQSQKLEAAGQLAGGIAHDFNNLLGVIIGWTDLLRRDIPAGDPRGEPLNEIRRAAESASGLTRQLLAFSRQQAIAPRVIDLDQVVADARRLVGSVVAERIQVAVERCDEPCLVRADPGQIEQLLVNLVVNACDAMPAGGKLTIATGRRQVEPRPVAVPGAHGPAAATAPAPGPYVVLRVQDTGHGMDEATLARIFEPFFTTKPVGKGTGLGLASVYGIVRQNGGFIEVDSTPDGGTTFRVHLPESREPRAETPPADAGAHAGRGSEVVLVVEDSEPLRRLIARSLESSGYTVLQAGDGRAALELAGRHAGPIDLVVTDVVMPVLGGRPLVEALARTRPETRVLYVSGHARDEVSRQGVLEPGTAYLQKPFTPGELAQRVRAVLDERPA